LRRRTRLPHLKSAACHLQPFPFFSLNRQWFNDPMSQFFPCPLPPVPFLSSYLCSSVFPLIPGCLSRHTPFLPTRPPRTMELMSHSPQRLLFAALAAGFLFAGCNRIIPTDLRPLDQAGMWYQSIEDLRKLDPTDAEVAQLVLVRRAGMSRAGLREP